MGGGGSGRSSRLRRGRCRGNRLTVVKGGGWARLGLVVVFWGRRWSEGEGLDAW